MSDTLTKVQRCTQLSPRARLPSRTSRVFSLKRTVQHRLGSRVSVCVCVCKRVFLACFARNLFFFVQRGHGSIDSLVSPTTPPPAPVRLHRASVEDAARECNEGLVIVHVFHRGCQRACMVSQLARALLSPCRSLCWTHVFARVIRTDHPRHRPSLTSITARTHTACPRWTKS